MKRAALLVSFLVAGFAVARLTAPTPTAPPPPVAAREAGVAPRIVGAGPAGASADQIRTIVRDELAALAPAPETDEPRRTDADEIVAAEASRPGPATTEARDRALSVVDQAIDLGRWQETDRDALRDQLATMTAAQADEVFAVLVPAINRGELQVEAAPPI